MLNKKAFFLDRDGIINEDLGYVSCVDDFQFSDGIFEACKEIKKKGYLIIVVTNQSGIGRGYYTEKEFQRLNKWMLNKFMDNNITIDDVFYCPHHPTHAKGSYKTFCKCRKPNIGMISESSLKYGINLEQSVIIGDKESDIKLGINSNIGFKVLVAPDNKLAFGQDLTLNSLADFLSIFKYDFFKVDKNGNL